MNPKKGINWPEMGEIGWELLFNLKKWMDEGLRLKDPMGKLVAIDSPLERG